MPQQQHIFKLGQSLAPLRNQWRVKRQNTFWVVLWIIILLIPGSFLVWGIEQILLLFLDYLSRSRPEIGAAIIAASGTIIVSVLSIVLTRWSERNKELDQKRREFDEKHREEYSQRCKKLLLALINTFGNNDLKEENLKIIMSSEFLADTYMWASGELIEDIVGLIDVILEKGAEIAAITSMSGKKTKGDLPREVYVALEKIIYRIRYEYGHEDKGLGEGDLIALSLGMKDIRPRKSHNLDWYTHMTTGSNLSTQVQSEDTGEEDLLAVYTQLQQIVEDLKKSGDPQSPQMANGKQSPSDEATRPSDTHSEKEDLHIPSVSDGAPGTPVVIPDSKPASGTDAEDIIESNGS